MNPAVIGVVGMLLCLSSSASAALMMGGDDDAGPSAGTTPPDPKRACPRTVTAKRTDSTGGWGMDLQFKCGDETVKVGPGGANEVTSDVVTLKADACPVEINKTNWLGGHTWPDTFKTTVSDCIDVGKTCPRKVTAKRTDSTGGWGMDLQFKCDDATVIIGPGQTNEVTSPTPVNINELSCPGIVSKSNWLGGHTWPDTFKVTVSDCQ